MKEIARLIGHRVGPVAGDYVQGYLDHNSRAGNHRLTIRTYLANKLKGRAFSFEYQYYHGMKRLLEELEEMGGVARVPSARGGESWVWAICSDCQHGRHEQPLREGEHCSCPCHGARELTE